VCTAPSPQGRFVVWRRGRVRPCIRPVCAAPTAAGPDAMRQRRPRNPCCLVRLRHGRDHAWAATDEVREPALPRLDADLADHEAAPSTRRRRRYRSPALEMPPCRGLPPVLFCRGTKPIQAAKCRADAKLDTSQTDSLNQIRAASPPPRLIQPGNHSKHSKIRQIPILITYLA
jgi:hypothetical protein